MERRNSYSRIVAAPTSAARIASVKNNRETLLLAKARKGLSSESNGTLRNFYREKAKANNFLQNVHSKSTEMSKAKRDKDEKVTIDDRVEERIGVISRNEVRDIMKAQRIRRASLDMSQTEETQRRIREFLSRDIPGGSSRNEQLRQLNSISDDGKGVVPSKFGEKIPENNQKRNAETPKLLRVRSRTSGICFSCSLCHLHCSPLSRHASVPNMAIKSGSEENRLYAPWKSSKTQFRKLSVPTPSQVFLNQNRISDVNTSYLSFTGSSTTSSGANTGTSLKPARTKKYSI